MTEELSPAVQELLAVLHRSRNEEWYQWIAQGMKPYTKEEYAAVLKKSAQKRENIRRAQVAKARQET